MNSVLPMLIAVVLNLVPGEVTTFTMEVEEREIMHFTKQADGGWKARSQPDHDLGTFYVDGAKLTNKRDGKEQTQDLSRMLGVGKDTSWMKLKTFRFGDAKISIVHKENGLDFNFRERRGTKVINETWPVRWIEVLSAKELDDFEAKLKADPQYLMQLLAEDRDKGETLLRAGQKQRPTARPWAMDVQMLFACDGFTGKSLQGEERVAHFKHALEYLQESYDIAVQALDKSHDEMLEEALPGLRLDLALAALEAGEVDSAKKHAAETLRNNKDQTNWNYGNIIHNANQILGRCAVREGKLADAKTYLLKAGATPGSPQLDSFGPQMQLARELSEKGEQETVLEYLDLVARFWANPDERTEANSKRTAREHLNQLEAWKTQLRAGKIPDHTKWK